MLQKYSQILLKGFTRKPPKYERFIRPTGLRFKKAHVTHPELKATFYLDILGTFILYLCKYFLTSFINAGVKKNPNSPLYTQLGMEKNVNLCKMILIYFIY